MNYFSVVILAAGEGKRMNSELPKVLHSVLSVPMIVRIIREVRQLNPYEIIIVVGKNHHQIRDTLNEYDITSVKYAIQQEPLGTADAVLCGLSRVVTSNILVLCGDTPFITSDILKEMINRDNSVLGMIVDNPYGYGRIVHDNEHILKIIEEKNTSLEEKKISLVNAGIYYLSTKNLSDRLLTLKPHEKEYYLTDIFTDFGHVIVTEKSFECTGINTREQLLKAEEMFLSR